MPAAALPPLTPRIAAELIAHEAIVTEAYRDQVGIWTWGIGITAASGHPVHPRYLDAPQPLDHCLRVFLDLLRTRYLPEIAAAFEGHPLAEHELAAALSFHYNTGAIATASWVGAWIVGDRAAAREAFLLWRKPPAVIPGRTAEAGLVFEGRWSSDGTARVIPVEKPGYRPDVAASRQVAILPILVRLLSQGTEPAR